MSVTDDRLRDAATCHVAAVIELVDLLCTARSAQWEARPGAPLITPVSVFDPTGEIASDTSRLRVRAGVEDTLTRLVLSTNELESASARLAHLLECHALPQRPT